MGSEIELPSYQSHKVVRAAKIGAMKPYSTDGSQTLDLILPDDVEEKFAAMDMTADWVGRFKPEVGGYLVVYEDGYHSYSPAKAFEEGYTRLTA